MYRRKVQVVHVIGYLILCIFSHSPTTGLNGMSKLAVDSVPLQIFYNKFVTVICMCTIFMPSFSVSYGLFIVLF